jgi:Alr-MurF fusion protein
MIYLDHIVKATQATLRHPGKHIQFDAFSHDTRQLVPGELFVAVRGGRNNGHDFLLDAIRKGATGLLVEARTYNNLAQLTLDTIAQSEVSVLVVEDTRLALQQYAGAILQLWHPMVIAVAGSVGKTSTKEAIATVLSSQFTTFRSWQNYNDLLGIPLSLGRLEARHEYAVLELGCDHPGEIADLCHILHPQIGVLTNIQPVQLLYFGSLKHLAHELFALPASLPPGGHLFYNQHDELLNTLASLYTEQNDTSLHLHPFSTNTATHVTHIGWDGVRGILNFGTPSAKAETRSSQRLYQQEQNLASPLLGAHHFDTMLAAYQVALNRGMHPTHIVEALTNLTSLPGRLNPLPGILNTRLLDDTHNASPSAVNAGLSTLNTLTPLNGRRIAVLGDMLNLGAYEDEAHKLVGQQVASTVDYLVTRGERAALIAESARQSGLPSTHIVMTATHEDAAQAVRHILSTTTSAQNQDVILLKGSEETRMERVTELLMAQPWEASEKLVRQAPGWKKIYFTHAERPTWVEIDLNAIASNTRHMKSLVGPHVQVLVALKADAYGHGALKVARTVLQNGATMLGVATVSEAIPLRDANINAPILVFGYVPLWQMREAVRLGVTVTLYSHEAAQELSRTALALGKTVKVHLKVDTGMGRLGIRYEDIDDIVSLVREIRALPALELEGLYTHFAQADARDQHYTRMQLARFNSVLETLTQYDLRPPLVHAANSAGALTVPEAHFDMVRPGIAIYGLHPSDEVPLPEGFRPALSFKTQVSQVKLIPPGEGISYGSTYITNHLTLVAVLPVGYADGFRRAPATWGTVLVHGQEAPIIGRVCMDQCMIDVTAIPGVQIGDEVVLIGRQGGSVLSAETIAQRLGTINYEVVSELLARVPRVD